MSSKQILTMIDEAMAIETARVAAERAAKAQGASVALKLGQVLSFRSIAR